MKRARKALSVLFSPTVPILVALFLLAPPTLATTVVPFTTRDLAQTAQAIVLAVCEGTESRAEPAASGWLFTYTRFRVTETIKGTALGPSITLRLPGGSTQEIAAVIAGVPAYQPGDEAVLFLTRTGSSGYPGLVGLEQGSYPVRTDPTTGKRTVRGVTGPHPKGIEDAMRARGTTSARSLKDFLEEIRSYLR